MMRSSMMQKIRNVLRNSLRRHNFSVMVDKALLRWKERDSGREESIRWCTQNAQPLNAFLQRIDEKVWRETESACARIRDEALQKLSLIDIQLGGGGNYPLLYFLTRFLEPGVVVETGVAAGWSSQAILLALRNNSGDGQLYSSDFPYFRHENPESLIGCIVDDELKADWTLLIEGDKFNLPRIVSECGRIDLFHYDSDKSFEGRRFALACAEAVLAPDAIVVFDDIQDNLHFADLVENRDWAFHVFEFEGKYIGLTGPGARALER